MKVSAVRIAFLLTVVLMPIVDTPARAQAGFDDDRVMLQGFYWESYRHGDPEVPPAGHKKLVRDRQGHAGTIREGRFDLIWLPPPSYAGDSSAGYNPKQYFRSSTTATAASRSTAPCSKRCSERRRAGRRHRHQPP